MKAYRITWMLLMVVLTVSSAAADELRLSNGDRITGDVLRLADGRLLIRTDYAGEMTIEWSTVELLRTQQPLPVVFKNGTTGEGDTFVRAVEDRKPEIIAGGVTAGIDIDSVAEINAEPKPPVKITAWADAGISRERGNTDNENYNLLAELVARHANHRFSVGGKLNRQWTDGNATAKNWRGFGKYDYFFRKSMFFYLSALFESNEFSDLRLRSTYGGGGGHQFFESERVNLSVSLGAAYVSADFFAAPDEKFAALQWVNRYDQYFFGKTFQLFHDDNGYISLEQSDNWLINTRQGIRFPLYKGLRLTLQYNYDYANQPPAGVKSKWDSVFLLLLGYQFEN